MLSRKTVGMLSENGPLTVKGFKVQTTYGVQGLQDLGFRFQATFAVKSCPM